MRASGVAGKAERERAVDQAQWHPAPLSRVAVPTLDVALA